MGYKEFIESKIDKIKDSGFEISIDELNANLFDFQKFIVKTALKKGRYAIFADCGLGKTLMQLEWAVQVYNKTKQPILILAPLAVSQQTINEGVKFGIEVKKYDGSNFPIQISNYEQIDNINIELFSGIVLDESSILKNYTGVYKNKIIDVFQKTLYKLCCTATPSPNDINEIGNHSEFLDIMDSYIMRMRWFVRDEGMNNYRLKKHSILDFYGWVASWATVIRTPKDIGFDDCNYILPNLNLIEKQINTDLKFDTTLFNETSVNATTFNKALRDTMQQRLELTANIVNNSNENFIIWINQNAEEDLLLKLIPDAKAVRGSESVESKEKKLIGFANNEYRVLITKKKIGQFGLNFQNCNNQIFASLDFSFEGFYQAIRRSYRFGQKKEVNIYIITTDTMSNVAKSIEHKQNQFNEMMTKIIENVNNKIYRLKMDYDFKEIKNEHYHIMRGDSCEIINKIESNSIDLSIFSPPFSNLFTYSDNIRDLGNSDDEIQFFEQNQFILDELYRIMKPGRLVCVHTKDIAKYKGSSGYSGMYDFTGDYHRAMEKAGFKYHSKITIWTDPVLEMQRTKTQRLLYKQVTKDSTSTGIGMPEYVTIFKKWEGSQDDWTPVTNLNKKNFPLDTWQKWASPVWFDILRTDVLTNYRNATAPQDEKHICPLQLSVIERLIHLYSNENEKVFTPFMGIGSEVYKAVENNRYGIGIELKDSYFDMAEKNINIVTSAKKQITMFE